MFSTINTILVFSLFVLIFFQPNRYRLVAAAIYASVMMALEVLYLSGFNRFETPPEALFYYGSAGLFAVGVMIILVNMRHMTEMVYTLQAVCLASVFANIAGFVLWYFYVSPVYYNLMLSAIYAWAVFTLIRRDKQDVGQSRNVGDSRASVFLRPAGGIGRPGHRDFSC